MANYGGDNTLSTRNSGSGSVRAREHQKELTWMDPSACVPHAQAGRMGRKIAKKPTLESLSASKWMEVNTGACLAVQSLPL